jgi:chitinase
VVTFGGIQAHTGVQDSFNVVGDNTMQAVRTVFGWNGSPSTWPSYVTVNLMTMDYGAPAPGVCVVRNGLCDMGQSAIQAAFAGASLTRTSSSRP